MAGQVQNDIENESSKFDAVAFAEQLYSIIDQYRSHISAKYNELTVAAPLSPGGIGETKLNAFYRMIGLPATSDPTFANNNSGNKNFLPIISQDGTINYFKSIYENHDEDKALFEKIRDRNERLTMPPDPQRFATFMFEPTGLSESLNGSEHRTSIFPLIVDAAVPVFPLNRRLAPSFRHTINGEDYIPMGSKTRLSRPLIDNIIYMRFKTINNADGVKALEDQLKTLVDYTGITTAYKTSLTFIDLSIRTKLLQILKGLATKFDEARKEAQTLSTKIEFVMTHVENPEMRSAQSTEWKEAKIYSLDNEISQIKAAIAQQNAIAFMLPTEQVKRREEIRRVEHSISTSNITQDVLISQLNNLITYEADDLNRKLQEKQYERSEKLTLAEGLKRQIMYYTGEYSGLSIFDAICVIYGLFAIDTEYLLGLLNPDARSRLMEDEFFKPHDSSIQERFGAKPKPVGESLKALEKKIREAFSIVEAFASAKAKTQ